jgi:hypothetical protein
MIQEEQMDIKVSVVSNGSEEYFAVDECPGVREQYEKDTGLKWPATRRVQLPDGTIQSWFLMTDATRKFLGVL